MDCISGNHKAGRVVINYASSCREEELFYACHNGDSELAMELIEQGADINAKELDEGVVVGDFFSCACKNGLIEVVSKMIDMGVDVNSGGLKNFSPIVEACKNGHIDVVVKLVESGARIEPMSIKEGTEEFKKIVQSRICDFEVSIIKYFFTGLRDIRNLIYRDEDALVIRKISQLEHELVVLKEFTCDWNMKTLTKKSIERLQSEIKSVGCEYLLGDVSETLKMLEMVSGRGEGLARIANASRRFSRVQKKLKIAMGMATSEEMKKTLTCCQDRLSVAFTKQLYISRELDSKKKRQNIKSHDKNEEMGR